MVVFARAAAGAKMAGAVFKRNVRAINIARDCSGRGLLPASSPACMFKTQGMFLYGFYIPTWHFFSAMVFNNGIFPPKGIASMSAKNGLLRTCAVCGENFPDRNVVSGEVVRKELADEILKVLPTWSSESYICRPDLAQVRGRYVHALLESERGELTTLEHEVVRSLQEHEILSSNIGAEFEQQWSFGERLADKIAVFGGSWAFLILFGVFLLFWVAVNSVVFLWRPVDPYPFIFLNLILSCLAAVQAPIIMMSQNRQEAKDRIRSEHDYQINLKAELEIRHLHEKMDHLLSHQWERLVQIQELQLEMLADLGGGKHRPPP